MYVNLELLEYFRVQSITVPEYQGFTTFLLSKRSQCTFSGNSICPFRVLELFFTVILTNSNLMLHFCANKSDTHEPFLTHTHAHTHTQKTENVALVFM